MNGREAQEKKMIAPSTPAHRVCQYHAHDSVVLLRFAKIRAATQELVETIVDMCPPSADRSAAIRHIREGMMSANASLAVDQDDVNLLNREPQVPDEVVTAEATADDIADLIDDEDRPF